MYLPVTVRIEIWVWVAFQVALVVFAVRVYRSRRTKPLLLLMWACIAYAFPGLAWYTFYAVRAALRYPMLAAHRAEVPSWQAYSDRAFQIIFMALLLCSFYCFIRESQTDATRKV